MENKLLDYLMGDLDWTEREAVEEAIRTQPEIKTLWKQLQLGLETEVTSGPATVAPRKSLRGEILESLPESTQLQGKGAVNSPRIIRWFHWSGWGIAACVLLGIVWLRPPTQTNGLAMQDGLLPVLAVYDLHASTGGRQQPATLLREIIYQKNTGYDALLRAELIAEQLWNNPLSGMALASSNGHSMGFVVIDLQGQQGFLGLYQNTASMSAEPADQQLWLAEGSGKHLKSMGKLPSSRMNNEGVYYFSFQNQNMQSLVPDVPIPVIGSDVPHGI